MIRMPKSLSQLDTLVFALLNDGPRLRRFLDSSLVYGHGFRSTTVTNRLRVLSNKERGGIYRASVPYNGSEKNCAYLYSLKPVQQRQVEDAINVLEHRDSVLDGIVMGDLAEDYVHWLLYQSGRFHVPRLNRSGRHGRYNSDIIVNHKNLSWAMGPYLFEVKNEYEAFHPSSPEIFKLICKASNEGAMPFFVAAHMHAATLELCDLLGIRTLHLKRQLVPARSPEAFKTKGVVEKLRGKVLGPTPYEFMPKRFAQDGRRTTSVASDLVSLCDDEIERRAMSRWADNCAVIRKLIIDDRSWTEMRSVLIKK